MERYHATSVLSLTARHPARAERLDFKRFIFGRAVGRALINAGKRRPLAPLAIGATMISMSKRKARTRFLRVESNQPAEGYFAAGGQLGSAPSVDSSDNGSDECRRGLIAAMFVRRVKSQ